MRSWLVENVVVPTVFIGGYIGAPQALIWMHFFPPKERHYAEAGMIYGLTLGFKMFVIDVVTIAALIAAWVYFGST